MVYWSQSSPPALRLQVETAQHFRKAFWGSVAARQFNGETTALAQFGGNADPATHPFEAFFYNGQAYAGAGKLVGIEPFEHMEDALEMRGVDANAIVLDVQADQFANGLSFDKDRGNDARRIKLHRIDD